MRQEPDYFGEDELVSVYVAKRLDEALRLEKLLTDSGLDYLVEPDSYTGGIIFRRQRVGAFFYVAPAAHQATSEIMQRGGFKPYDTGPA